MSDSENQSLAESVRSRVDSAGVSVPSELDGVRRDVSRSLDERTSAASEYAASLRQDPAGTLQRVVAVLEEYIQNNDIDITVSGHEIHVRGDEDGLRRVNAELAQVLNGEDVRFEYDRDAGVDVEYGQKAQ